MSSATAKIRPADAAQASANGVVEIRLCGTVQGVGFRPFVWRLADACKLDGDVRNDANGVLIRVRGPAKAVAKFKALLQSQAPPLARIDHIESRETPSDAPFTGGFQIVKSATGKTRTQVTPDAATCPACIDETLSPFERRFRYPFTNCTNCGPRFSIIEKMPYDRAATTMSAFAMCDDCAKDYSNPADRRFHAQPIACHKCGPRAWIERLDGAAMSFEQASMLDSVDAALGVMHQGAIIAIRGLGGFHLACDATNEQAVSRLRERKNRYGKPFALMARDLDVIRRYARVSDAEAAQLAAPQAPIVLLEALPLARAQKTDPVSRPDTAPDTPPPMKAKPVAALPEAIAPGMTTLGFMLPYMPMHHIMLRRMDRPIVMTSGNRSDEPQVTSIEDAKARLAGIADYALYHNRDIANRIDDSVVRIMAGQPRVLRRARGFAPSAMALPEGFEDAPDLIAYGGELKAAFSIVKDGACILSQHQGDLENADTFDDYQKNLALYQQLYDHTPQLLAVDKHPEYLSTKLGRQRALKEGRALVDVQHHHAHIASCMAENAIAIDAPPVLGVALDGLGFGDDGSIWGGEFLLANYQSFERLGTFKPVAMPGGAQAIHEPWRSAYAHIVAEMGWAQFAMNYAELELFDYLKAKPRQTLNQMLTKGINAPLASSCGRLFDAVAATIGLVRERAQFEGQGAMALEAVVDADVLHHEDDNLAYPFAIPNLKGTGLPYIEPIAMWQALLGDLILQTPKSVMATRFHKGLAKIICAMVNKIKIKCEQSGTPFQSVALSGGCFQNKILLEQVQARLLAGGFEVLLQSRVPANDGGLALGQAAIAAARHIKQTDTSGGR